ncbi:MAG: glycoside hydrolase family 43 protein [Eubacteriales bacterium]
MRFIRLFSAVLAAVLVFNTLTFGVSAVSAGDKPSVFEIDPSVVDMTNTRKTSEIIIRDPFVLVYGQKYFMYGTGASSGPGYGCYVSEDLENWTGPVNVFSAPAEFDGINCFWAPECHFYQGRFYLFATYFSQATQHRGVSVFKSESPLGPFEEISAGHITPHDWDSIDGTLYIDNDGQPWMVFVHEWTSMPDHTGAMAAAKLSDDLSRFISDPIQLFKAKDPIWTDKGVTDGPFMYRTKTGKLLMLWSNGDVNGNYCVGIAKSRNSEITGTWAHGFEPFYSVNRYFDTDGGHAMMFTDLNGRLLLCMHSPNRSDATTHETATFLEIVDKGDMLELKQVQDIRAQETDKIKLTFSDISTFFNELLSYMKSVLRPVGQYIQTIFS